MIDRVRARTADAGFSLVEMMMVVAIIGVLAAITVPMSGNALRFLKVSGDARSLSNATAVA
jgi:prepilin-type N-terminal cleavage/methylation domain-containing protein